MYQELRIFRPHRTPAEQLEKTFVGREPILQEVLAKLDRWQPGKSRQHYLVIGPRGIGKTNLLRMIEHRIEKTTSLNRKWHVVPFSEDAYGITSVSDLLVETLHILAAKMGAEHIKQSYDRIKYDDDDQRVTDLALDAFRQFHRENHCGILLMVENVNRVLERQVKNKKEINLLRKVLIEEDWLMLICTSPTYLNAVTRPEEPLFEFFQVIFLEELTPAEQQEMLKNLARLEKNEDFIDNYLNKLKPQIQALYHFTGGNPRLTIMLYDLISNQRIKEVKNELDALLDQLTPFYQDRMKEVGEQEAKLLERMALIDEGCTPTELAKESRMQHKSVRSLLSRLERAGYVRREPRRQKQTVYIIPERFFRIWHQMNHSRAARGRIQYLLEFFTSWYSTRKDRKIIWKKLSDEFQEVLRQNEEVRMGELIEYMEYIEDISHGREKYIRHFDRLHKLYILKGYDAIVGDIEKLDKKYQNEGKYFLNKGFFLSKRIKKREEALMAFKEANRLIPDDFLALFNIGLLLDHFNRNDEAKEIYKRIIVLLKEKKNFAPNINTEEMLVKIFQDENDPRIEYIVSYLLPMYSNDIITEKIIEIIDKAKSSSKKQAGIITLGLFKSIKAIPILLNFLKDKAVHLRGSAAVALGEIGSNIAIQSLIDCLKDNHKIVRGSAATALGRIGSELAVPALIDCLKDEDKGVRGGAATALGLIRSDKAVLPLIESLKDEFNNVRGSAAAALGRIGSDLAVQDLITCLKDNANNVRISSIISLGKINLKKPITNIDSVIKSITEIKTEEANLWIIQALRNFLDSVYHSGNMEMIGKAVGSAVEGFENGEEIFKPYVKALEYLKAERNPAIMERQQPEMREAVQLLVDAFDHNPKS